MADKVGVLFLQAQAGFGADAAVHADIMRNLDRDRFDVHLACTAGNGDSTPPSLAALRGLPRVRLRVTRFAPSLAERDLSALIRGARTALSSSVDFWALRKYLIKERISVIHSSERPRDSAYNLSLAKLTGARSVIHVHVKWSPAYGRLARFAVQRADAVFSISKYVTETVVSTGKSRGAIYTVPNGIETARWDPSIDGSALREELGIPREALVLASVSRLFSWKGQRELLRAFAQLSPEFPNSRLLIVGDDAGEVEGSSFSGELKALALTLGLEKRVIFTGLRTDIPEVMAACDVFTMPSFEEPFGLVFLEAMAMQKPVIAIDNGGTPEVVEHGRSGLLSPPWDVPALTANIRILLRDGALRARMGEHGRAQVLRHFNAQRMARDAGRAYERLLSSPG